MKNREENEIERMQIKKLEQALYTMDFSEVSNKKRVEERVFNKVKEPIKMRKHFKLKKTGIVAATVLLIGGTMQTAAAQDFMEKVIKTISTGHIVVSQYEKEEWTSVSVPKSLQGKIYLKDGTPVTEFTPDMSEIYTSKGEKIANIDIKTGAITTEKEEKAKEEDTTLIEYDMKKLNKYLCFDVKLPTYLPQGYEFDYAEFYKDEEGKVEQSKYITLIFSNSVTGKQVSLQERFADEETAYETGTDGSVEKVDINGVKAILSDGKNLDWEADGLLFSFYTQNNISSEELLKVARSLQ